MRLKQLLCFTLFLLAACTHKTIEDAAVARTMMFPNGSYQHEVTLQLAGQKAFHFSGAVEVKDDHFSLAAFSFFGTTLFRITDDRKNTPTSVKTEIYADQIKPHEAQMKQFYNTIKSMLTIPYAGERTRELETPSGLAKLTVEHVDAKGIPDVMSVTNAHFNLQIKVVGYEI